MQKKNERKSDRDRGGEIVRGYDREWKSSREKTRDRGKRLPGVGRKRWKIVVT